MYDNGNSSRAKLLQGLYLLAAMNAETHEETRKAITTDLSHQHNTGDKVFLSCVVNGEKPASTTLNPNLNSNCRNCAKLDSQGRKNSRVWHLLEKSWLQ
jgi:hypothetical protein